MTYFIATLWALMSALLFTALGVTELGGALVADPFGMVLAGALSALSAFAVFISSVEGV